MTRFDWLVVTASFTGLAALGCGGSSYPTGREMVSVSSNKSDGNPSTLPGARQFPTRELVEVVRKDVLCDAFSDGEVYWLHRRGTSNPEVRRLAEAGQWSGIVRVKAATSAEMASQTARELGPDNGYAWKHIVFQGDPGMLGEIELALRRAYGN